MDYTYLGLEKIEDELIANTRRKESRIGAVLIRLVFLAFIAAVVTVGALGYGVIRGIIDDAPDVSTINISPSGFATFIYDTDGNQLQKLTAGDSNRTSVPLKNVPVSLRHAVVAIEDERFYEHNGIDPKGIIRAFFVGVRNRFHFNEGASTITQQLLKNNVFTGWTEEKSMTDRIKRKVQEQYLAVQLEKRLNDKDLILENYLNTINLGAGTYGVQAAAKKYFGKDVRDLTLSESAVIAGITKNPSKYNPIRHPEENAERRERILRKMVEQNYITEAEMQEALADNVYERIADAQLVEEEKYKVYSYFIDELIDQVADDLMMQKGYTDTQAYQLIYSGGLRIFTTQDPGLQKICDEEYSNPKNFPENTEVGIDWAITVQHEDGTNESYSKEMMLEYFKNTLPKDQAADFDLLFKSEKNARKYIKKYKNAILSENDTVIAERTEFIPQPQSSLVLMEQSTGYVKALVGGRGEKNASLVLNRASATYRQPGSTFKILSTYAPAIDRGKISIGSYINDEPYKYLTGKDVHNVSDTYRGWITVREAIAQSVNVAAVKVLTEMGVEEGFRALMKFGFTSLNPAKDSYQPLALGGISKGVSNLELTAAYAAIANEGTYIKPIFYTKIMDQNGEVLIDNTAQTTRVIGADTAAILTDALQDVVKEGTGTAVQLDSNMPVAGKTGTTSDYNDVWFVGYTPYYTMGIWAGYDNDGSRKQLPEEGTFRDFHKTLWKAVMDRISKDQQIQQFRIPETVMMAETCGISGLLPTSYCEHVARDLLATRYKPFVQCEVCSDGLEDSEYDFEFDEAEISEEPEQGIAEEALDLPVFDPLVNEEELPAAEEPAVEEPAVEEPASEEGEEEEAGSGSGSEEGVDNGEFIEYTTEEATYDYGDLVVG